MGLLLYRSQVFSWCLSLFLASHAAAVSSPDGRCQSSSLFQTNTHQHRMHRDDHTLNLTSWKKLFPAYSVLDLDEMSDSAVALALDTCSTMPTGYCDGFAKGNTHINKSAVWKMLNPAVYAASDGSIRTLALVTDYSLCQCAGSQKSMCEPDNASLFSGLLVSCGADDGCTAVGPGLDPHAFQFEGHPMAFTNQGGSGVCHPKLVNLTSFEQTNLTAPGQSDCEKNWQPFTHNGTLLFTQWIHPNHKVLRCGVETGSCEVAFETKTTLTSFGIEKIHGSTPYAELDSNYWVAAAHTFKIEIVGPVYKHMFFAIERQPPFAVVAHTEWFQLPVAEHYADADWVGIEYAGGLMRRGPDFILSYGVGDCVSQATKISVEELKEALGL